MNLSKASDCGNHDIWVAKLRNYRVGTIHKSVKKVILLTENAQWFGINNQHLWVHLLQEERKGWLLDLCSSLYSFIDDIANTSEKLSFIVFSDDTTVYLPGKNLKETITNIN